MEVGEHALPAFNLNSGRDVPGYSFSAISAASEEAPKAEATDQMALNGGEREYSAAPPSAAAVLTRCPSDVAAMKVQKHYRSYRTRRMLADSAVVAEELWRQALDFAQLRYSTVSFFNLKPETAAARWSRTGLNASKVGKGLSKDAKAQKLAFQHWIEAIDPRHRYGHSLHLYYEEWCKSNSGQPFFYWLDLGDGRFFDHKECRRSRLLQECIEYLGPIERQHYVYEVVDGKLLNKLSGKPLTTTESSPRSKWIFVMCTSKRLYIGEKTKGRFHHSSFLAGGATLAAGKLMAEDGVLKAISPYSGHYKPTDDILKSFLSYLKENGVNLDQVKILKANEGYETPENGESSLHAVNSEASMSDTFPPDLDPPTELDTLPSEPTISSNPANGTEYKRSLSGGLQSPKPDVPRKALLERINSKKLPTKWSTGAGPRIGCISDYPLELRLQAMELTHLSPKTSPQLSTPGRAPARMVSPSAYPSNGTNDEHEAYFNV